MGQVGVPVGLQSGQGQMVSGMGPNSQQMSQMGQGPMQGQQQRMMVNRQQMMMQQQQQQQMGMRGPGPGQQMHYNPNQQGYSHHN